MLRKVLFSAKPILDSEFPVVNSAADGVSHNATSDKRRTGMGASIIDCVITFRKVVNAYPLSVDFEALGVANGNFCCLTIHLKFCRHIQRVVQGTDKIDVSLRQKTTASLS